MLDKGKIKKLELTGHQHEPGYQSFVLHNAPRKPAPKREVRGRVSGRIKKGPLESRG
jgi:hypothetical protein